MTSYIRDLTELTAVANNDYLLISDTSDVTNKDKRISQLNLVGANFTGGGTIATGGFTLTVPATGTAALRGGTTPVGGAGRIASWLDANTVQDSGFVLSDMARLSTAQSFAALKTFSAGLSFGGATLANYEEGSFTPGLTFGGGAVGLAASVANGFYTRIGNRCFYGFDYRLTNKGTSTGNASITGLPFASADGQSLYWARYQNLASTYIAVGLLSAAGVVFALVGSTVASASNAALLTDAAFTNTTTLLISGIYRI